MQRLVSLSNKKELFLNGGEAAATRLIGLQHIVLLSQEVCSVRGIWS